MKIRRHYSIPEGWERQTDDSGNCTNPPPLDHIEVIHTGFSAEQNFSTDFVLNAVREGWGQLTETELRLNVRPEALVYAVRRKPGCYCLHCNTRIERGERGELAQLHVATEHAGETVEGNPAGYEVLHHFECILDAVQHERLKAGG